MTRAVKYLFECRKAILLLTAALLFASVAGNARAAICTSSFAGGKLQPECPNGKITRTDISPKCIEDINNNANNCINTMPTGGVSRIPEDVCYRGAGWGRQRPHMGMDYAAPLGAVVTAAADGKITRVTGNIAEPPAGSCSSYGNVIYIEHQGCEGKYYTRYGHLHEIAAGIRVGSEVKKGDVLAYVGGTGGACGRYHLHFEMRGPSDELINPLCNDIQKICNCDAKEVPLDSCRDAEFEAGSPADVKNTAAVNGAAMQYEEKDNLWGKGGCNQYEEVRQSYRDAGCYFCKPFAILFNTASVMAKKSFDALSKAVINVVLIAVAIWLAIITLRFVSSMEIKEPRNYVKTVLSQLFRVLVVYMLLNLGLGTILYFTVDPVFMAGLNLAQTAGRISEECTVDGITIITSAEGGLPQELGRGIVCTIKSMQDQIADIFAMGHVLFCLAIRDHAVWGGRIPNFAYLLTSVVLYLGALILLLSYPFLLVDAVLKMSIAVALLPAALGAFAFKLTSKYLGKVWETFLNGMFSFIFLSIIILIITSAAAEEVAKILQNRDAMGPFAIVFWWGVEVLKVVFICLLGWAVLSEAKSFTDKFASGIALKGDIGSNTGSSFNEFAYKRPGLKAGKALWKGAKKTGKVGRNILGSYANNLSMRAGNKIAKSGWGNKNGFTRAVSSVVGIAREVRDENGKVMYDTTNLIQKLRGEQVLTSFDQTAHNIKKTTTVNNRKTGNKIKTIENDRYGKVKSKYDAMGNQTSQDSTIRSITKGNISRKDGTIDMAKLENFMQNAMFSEEQKQMMIAQKLMSERMNGNYQGGRLDDVVTSRNVEISTDSQGRKVVTIHQVNADNSTSSFKMTYCANNRIRFETETIGTDGKGTGFATDGIVEKKSYIEVSKDADGNETGRVSLDKYAFSDYYSNKTSRPLYVNGEVSPAIPQEEITFSKEEMQAFVNQVTEKGNKYYTFKETS